MNDKTILLVEDSPDDEELTLRALRNNRIRNDVHVARDGQQALDYFFGDGAEHRPVPAVVLLDLKLPGVDGLEVLRRLRGDDRTKLQPVVILTSSAEDRDLLQGYSLGANSYIRKPVDFTQFMQAVQNLGLYWLVLNEAAPGQAPRPS